MTRFTSSIWWRIFTTLTLFLTTLTGFWSHAQFPRLAFFRGVLAAVIGVLSLLAGGLGGFGNADGTGFTPTLFNDPSGVAVDGAGNVYVADRDNHTIRKITATGVVTTFAGTAGSSGSVDGTGAAGRFNTPKSVAVDVSGNVYVADYWNHTVRKISTGGVVTTLAGTAGSSGSADGTGAAARFNNPAGVAVDGSGTVYVADYNNQTIRQITSGGVVTTLAGTAGSFSYADGTGAAARFYNPSGVAVDGSGNLFVADYTNQVIRKISSGGVVTTLAGTSGSASSADGTGAAARFNYPTGVAVDGSGNVYVADNGNHTVRKITSAGVVTTLAGSAASPGTADGTGAAARFYNPAGVAVDGSGNLYVADQSNHTIRKVTSVGVVSTVAGTVGSAGAADGTPASARLYNPSGVAVDGAGTVYVADRLNNTIRKVTSAGVVTTLAGSAGNLGSADGTGVAAKFNNPIGVAVDGSGTVYVADQSNHTIRMITSAGVVTTVAGAAGLSGSADGTGASARFANPTGVAVDGAGNLYVADYSNQIIRKVTSAGVVTTLAGTAGSLGSADGTGAAARFYNPYGIAVDGSGNLYVADQSNHTIRKMTSGGAVTTLAGTAGSLGPADGTGAAARFNNPYAVTVDASGNVYVADYANRTVRKITSAGAVTTMAGTAGSSGATDGTGAAARFSNPAGVAVDGSGSVYVADYANNTLRKITSAGAVTTIAGAAANSGSVDGTGASARFNGPSGVAVDGSGTVYVADQSNHVIRKITSGGVVTTLAGTSGSIGSTDATGAAARFYGPYGLAVDGAGNVYVAELFNSTIRMITPAGAVTTVAGTAGSSGSTDATGASARFTNPTGVAVDGAGNLYVADYSNQTIRKVTSAGVVTTLAGTAGSQGSADGTGAAARFRYPVGIAVDAAGNVYVADTSNHTIRMITPAGVVTTLAGSAGIPGSADGIGTTARFNGPSTVAVDGVGNVYVSDQSNHTVRKLTPTGTVTTVLGVAGQSGLSLGRSPALLNKPSAVAVTVSTLYVVTENSVLTSPKP